MTLHRFLATVATALVLVSPLAHANGPKGGDVAPNVLGKKLNGDQVLVSDYAGKVIVVSFWATWCAYCLKELPVLDGLQKVAGKDKVEVIAVNTEDRETFREAAKSLRRSPMTLAYDPGKVGATAYGVGGIPHLVIIGRDGIIRRVHRGYGEETLAEIVADVNSAIAARTDAAAAPAQPAAGSAP